MKYIGRLIILTLLLSFPVMTAGLLFQKIIISPEVAFGANVSITLLSPPNNAFLSGQIMAAAHTNVPVEKVEFYFVEESGRFIFTYDGNNISGNDWNYTWETNDSIDGVYQAYAIAVDNNNYTYLSQFNTIYVNNSGGNPPDPNLNINSNSNENQNINQNINVNYGNNNVNSNENINTNNANNNQNVNVNTNLPTNSNLNQNSNNNGNVNLNVNINTPLPPNTNQNQNTNIPTNINGTNNTNISNNNTSPNPDSDNDDLPDNEEIDQGTDPFNPDSDDDGLTDIFEVEHGFDPLTNDNSTPKRSADDTINQKIIQALNSGDPTQFQDSDHDGLPDELEKQLGSDPYDPDTSGDGLTDGFKAKNGYSLTDNNSNSITKKTIELTAEKAKKVEKTSYLLTGAILGIFLMLAVVVLFIFKPKESNK